MPHTLLLADDSVTIQRVIELTFADENVQVVAVSDGEQAIARLDGAPPDIVLADIGMPGKNGYEVAQYIKQTPRLAHIPVVLLAGAFEPIDQARASAAGCDGVLAKPFEPQQVIGRVKELLARGGSAPPTHVEPTPPPVAKVVSEKLAPAEIDSYFDRLNAAFAGLERGAPPADGPGTFAAPPPMFDKLSDLKPFVPPGAVAPPRPAEPPPVTPKATVEPTMVPPSINEQAAAAPIPIAAPHAAEARPASTAAATGTAPAGSAAVGAPAWSLPPSAGTRRTLPRIEDAFAALLAAEQNAPPPAAPPNWPSAPEAPQVVASDELVAQVTRRVLDQMSDRIVRETVADIVASVAERLVRDEIERIKSTIK